MTKLETLIACLPDAPYKTHLTAEIERLTKIEDAARNLVAQKGRHHTEIAYKKLEEVLK